MAAKPASRILGLLSFFGELPQWLYDCAASLDRIGIDRLIAVDGAYALFPGARACSTTEEHQALRDGCADAGIALDLVVMAQPWESECAKRTYLFRRGQRFTSSSDWYLVLDSDTMVKAGPH